MEKENFDHNQDMIEQANLVLKKCGGLPLAISTVGSFLATKPKTAMEWRNLNKHISAELETNPELGMIKTVLASSYEGLAYLFKCPFLYLSIFPEDHDIRWTRLVRRWVAEGYSRRIQNKSAEEIGNMYITELINRNMMRPSSKGTTHSAATRTDFLQVHDLVREIGISKSREENLVFTLEEGCNLDTQGKIRHLAVSSTWTRDKDVFESALDLSHLRSLTVFGEWESFFISDKMRYLRVLDLEDTDDLRSHHLHQIGQLSHLNYLSLRRCYGILRLPNSLGNLRQLQTLDVRGTRIIKLPRTVSNLQKLQYLRMGFVPQHDDEDRGKWFCPFYEFRRKLLFRCGSNNQKFCCCCYSCYYHCSYYTLKFCCCCFWFYIPAGVLLSFCSFLTSLPALFCYFWFLIWCFSRVLIKDGLDGLPAFFLGKDPHGVKFRRGTLKLKPLHTVGVININGEDAIFEDLQYLSELRKLKVTGVNKKNCTKFFSAIANHKYLESLLVRSEGKPGLSGCLDGVPLPPTNLESLKLYGHLVELPKWIEGLNNLVKLKLRSSMISKHQAAIELLGKLPNLAILRLWKKSFEGQEVRLSFQREAFKSLVMLELNLLGNLKLVEFGEGAVPKLEQLQFRGWRQETKNGLFYGLPFLRSLKEVLLRDSYEDDFMEDLRIQLARNPSRPVLKRN